MSASTHALARGHVKGPQASGRNCQVLALQKHVCREVYERLESWDSDRRLAIENEWPEYANSIDLVSTRAYLRSNMGAKDWRDMYLGDHVQRIQEKKQHHVHVFNAKGERVPLSHCQRADDPRKCNSDFPADFVDLGTSFRPSRGVVSGLNEANGHADRWTPQ